MTGLNNELLEKAKQAKSAEELFALAKENDVEMTEEQAKTAYAQLHPASGEIADDELENVAGGGCGGNDLQWPKKGDLVLWKDKKQCCPSCKSLRLYVEALGFRATKQINRKVLVRCANCGTVYEVYGPITGFTIL